jgi:lipopolysaccharide transport system ATP-binding protein
MPEPPAIQLAGVSKIYRLYGNQRDQVIDLLGLRRLGLKPRSAPKEFAALKGVDLTVPRGRRVGIVGRNGAGKTTLLKLVCGNFAPTSGNVSVNGSVQALLTSGVGFHPDYSGRENIEGAMQYNGLSRSEHVQAVEEIIEFCELGEFLDQPFKTYSLGMQARLMFAVATAVKPDILIVDEVLGAGDAYFVAKSKHRVQKLVRSGCTMLLVSHSMQQVLELCDEAIWLEAGQVRMRGDAFSVVKAYEQELQRAIHQADIGPEPGGLEHESGSVESGGRAPWSPVQGWSAPAAQDPDFCAMASDVNLPDVPRDELGRFHGVAPGGISRWGAEAGVKVTGFTWINEQGISQSLHALRPCKAALTLEVEQAGSYSLRYGIVIDDPMGQSVARLYSPCDRFEAKVGDRRVIELLLDPLQVGPGEYTLGISVLEFGPIEMINQARRFDLLGRSFRFRVELASSLGAVEARALLAGTWRWAHVPN